MKDLDKYLAELYDVDEVELDESKKTSFIKVTRQTKVDRAIGALATKMAKEMDDPYYRKMVKFRDKYFSMREKIRTKYAPKVRARAISGKGISDMIAKIKKQKGRQ